MELERERRPSVTASRFFLRSGAKRGCAYGGAVPFWPVEDVS